MKSALRRARGDSGQALTETAILLPIAIVLLITILDAGAYLLASQSVTSAADAIARLAEADATITNASAQAYLEQTYPDLDGAQASITAPSRQVEELEGGYKIWNAETGGFTCRPTEVGWDRREVTVTYNGRWTTPVMLAAAGIAAGTTDYTITKTVAAVNDATFEVW